MKTSVLSIIKKRYSCRRYRSQPVGEEEITALEEAVRWAPSACNRQPYRMVFITDRNLIAAIARAVPVGPASANAWITTAPLLVVACGRPEIAWHRLPQIIDKDYHRIDAAIALDHLSLVAADLGLGTCWVGWFHRKKVGKLLGISQGEEVVLLMTVGHPDEPPLEYRKRKPLRDLVSRREEGPPTDS